VVEQQGRLHQARAASLPTDNCPQPKEINLCLSLTSEQYNIWTPRLCGLMVRRWLFPYITHARGVATGSWPCILNARLVSWCSVMHVRTVAYAMEGMSTFEPLMPFEGPAAASLMAMLLLHDLASSAPQAGTSSNPMQLFASCGVHGGLWRCPYTFDSLGTAAYLAGLLSSGLSAGSGALPLSACITTANGASATANEAPAAPPV
jgi:hypothetical protein